MHFVHMLAIEADDKDHAREQVDTFLAEYGDGKVWDWYEIGGRWDGALDGENILRYSDKPEVFKTAVEDAIKSIDKEFRGLIRKMTGKKTTAAECEAAMPIEVADLTERRRAAERTAEMVSKYDADISKNLAEVAETEDRTRIEPMAAYYLHKISNILSNDYGSDSYFFDIERFSHDPSDLYARIESDPEHQFLVVVDLHN